jgi:hypothetical protein
MVAAARAADLCGRPTHAAQFPRSRSVSLDSIRGQLVGNMAYRRSRPASTLECLPHRVADTPVPGLGRGRVRSAFQSRL